MTETAKVDSNHPSPKKISQIDPTTLGIVWTDGHESVYSVKMLREKCPCANCIDEWTGEKRIKPGMIPDTIRPKGLKSVGLYAVQFTLNDGHDTWLYPHELLRKLCECAACKKARTAGQG